MTHRQILNTLRERSGRREKSLAVLIDPDKHDEAGLRETVRVAEKAQVDFLFAGSSLMLKNNFEDCVRAIKQSAAIPVVIFPGNRFQISTEADALLLLSLISGRNPDLLIGQHVAAAAELRRSNLEIIPTGYMLIDGGNLTSVNYISQTLPIPRDKTDIAVATAVAGELLGLQLIYLEAGSGAQRPVSAEMIAAVRGNVHVPLITGGGIRSGESAYAACKAGADLIVVGNGFEEDASRIFEIAAAVKEASGISSTKKSAA